MTNISLAPFGLCLLDAWHCCLCVCSFLVEQSPRNIFTEGSGKQSYYITYLKMPFFFPQTQWVVWDSSLEIMTYRILKTLVICSLLWLLLKIWIPSYTWSFCENYFCLEACFPWFQVSDEVGGEGSYCSLCGPFGGPFHLKIPLSCLGNLKKSFLWWFLFLSLISLIPALHPWTSWINFLLFFLHPIYLFL